jgi:hypothetical protein
MKKATLLMLLFAFIIGANAQEVLYDFNDLDEGNLNGQDNWTTVINAGGSPNSI